MKTIIDNNISFANHKGIEFCLPILKECEEFNGGILSTTECDDLLCATDRPYALKWKKGENLIIQLQELNTGDSNISQPVLDLEDWMEITICDESGSYEPIGAKLVNKMSGWSADCCRAIQRVEIDTSELSCFRIRFNNGDRVLYSREINTFESIDACNLELMEIVSNNLTDCQGTCYDEITAYTGTLIENQNKIYLEGFVRLNNRASTKEIIGSKSITNITDVYTFQTGTKIGYWMAKYIQDVFFYGRYVTIDGIRYEVPPQDYENILTSGNNWVFSAELNIECKSDAFCDK